MIRKSKSSPNESVFDLLKIDQNIRIYFYRSFCFVHNENSRYLISSSEEYLVVWNLQTCFIEWQMQARVLKLTPDPYSKYFAAFIQFRGEKKSKDRVHRKFCCCFLLCFFSFCFCLLFVQLKYALDTIFKHVGNELLFRN